MKHSSIAAIAILATLAFALPVMAQDENPGNAPADSSGPELGRVVQGNRTIVFAPADTGNIDAGRLRTWNEFAEGHPKVAKALAYNSSLMNDNSYLSKHPALNDFFRAHPDIKEAMAENPGNFVAIQPRPGE
jgi:hypothetical protein